MGGLFGYVFDGLYIRPVYMSLYKAQAWKPQIAPCWRAIYHATSSYVQCTKLKLQDQSRSDARRASGRAELDAAADNAGCSGSRKSCAFAFGVSGSSSRKAFQFGMGHPLAWGWLLRVFISFALFGNLVLFFFAFNVLGGQRTILFIDVFKEVHCVGLWGLHNTFPWQETSVRAVFLDVLDSENR